MSAGTFSDFSSAFSGRPDRHRFSSPRMWLPSLADCTLGAHRSRLSEKSHGFGDRHDVRVLGVHVPEADGVRGGTAVVDELLRQHTLEGVGKRSEERRGGKEGVKK